jgi:hypothetical protein
VGALSVLNNVCCSDPAQEFGLDPRRAMRRRELADLAEWRAIKRR